MTFEVCLFSPLNFQIPEMHLCTLYLSHLSVVLCMLLNLLQYLLYGNLSSKLQNLWKKMRECTSFKSENHKKKKKEKGKEWLRNYDHTGRQRIRANMEPGSFKVLCVLDDLEHLALDIPTWRLQYKLAKEGRFSRKRGAKKKKKKKETRP